MTREERTLWAEIKRQVAVRDRHRCQRCYDRVPASAQATAHHILPRVEGGGENLDNLVWLCHPCHDFVEIQDPPLRNAAEIEGSIAPYVHFDQPRPRPWQAPGHDLSAEVTSRGDRTTLRKQAQKAAEINAPHALGTKTDYAWACPPCGVRWQVCPSLKAVIRAEFAHRKKHHPLSR